MAPPKKYPDELRERATRMVVEARKDPVNGAGAIKRIADQLGIHPEALRVWVKRAEVDDEIGRKIAERTVGTTSEHHLQALEWAGQWPVVRFAVEDCRHVTRRLEADLLRAGQSVVRVPTQLMAAARRSGRQPGKSDPIDALAVAHATLREPNLAVARLDGPAREVKLLTDYRHNLVVERTILVNRLRRSVERGGDPG